jgi:thymidylate kinase
MLITISGMVGSGKTTAAAQIVKLLKQNGIEARHVRFQSLPCFTLFKRRSRTPQTEEAPVHASRWSGYRRKRLTARLAVGHALRMFLFRGLQFRNAPPHAQVMDRYFYDSFAHFEMRARSERLYQNVLHRLIPRADLSILLLVPPQTAAARCPDYSPEYLKSVADAYETLRARFGELVEVRSDSVESGTTVLNPDVINRVRSAAQRAGRS